MRIIKRHSERGSGTAPRWALVAALACASIGCTALPGTVPDVRPERLKRVKEAARAFDERRDEVEFQAATACWRHHDAEGCRHLLGRLLKRNADHLPARLLLTETYLVEDRLDQAEETFVPAKKDYGDDPRVLHMAGMLAEAAGDSKQALTYYQRAAKLAPGDEIYRLSYEAVKDDLAEAKPARLAKHATAAKRTKVKTAASKKRPGKPTEQAERQASSHGKSHQSPPSESRSDDVHPATATSREKDESVTADAPSKSRSQTDGSTKRESTADQPILRATSPARQLSFTDDVPSSKSNEVGQDHTTGKPPSPAADDARLADLPEAAKKLLAKGDAALSADAVDSAHRFFRQAQQAARQEPQVAISAAVMAMRHDELELAAEVAGDGLKAFPRSAGLYRVLGTVRYRLGDYPAARQALEEAIALDNSQALSYFLMGSTLLKLGQPEAAERHFQQARRLDARYAKPATG